MFQTYILYSEKYDRFYIGQTHNLEQRLTMHNAGMVKSTKRYVPWKLVYYELFASRSAALKRERFLKNQKNKEFYRKLVAQWQSPEDSGLITRL